jgi:hypothetical protein
MVLFNRVVQIFGWPQSHGSVANSGEGRRSIVEEFG